jgi:hypothetical protein
VSTPSLGHRHTPPSQTGIGWASACTASS